MTAKQIKAINKADKPVKAFKEDKLDNLPIDIDSIEIERNIILKFDTDIFKGISGDETIKKKHIENILSSKVNVIYN